MIWQYIGGDAKNIKPQPYAEPYDYLVAYILIEDMPKDGIFDLANLHASVGYLSYATNGVHWSIIDDGEIIFPNEVGALLEILEP